MEEKPEIPISEVLPRIIDAASSLRSKIFFRVIEMLCKTGNSELTAYTNELVSVLLEITARYIAIADDNEYMEGPSERAVEAIFTVLDDIPDNDSKLYELVELVIPGVTQIFVDYPENSAYESLFLLLGLFSTRMNNHAQCQYESMVIILSIISQEHILESHTIGVMCQIVWYMYPLITDPNSAFLSDEVVKEHLFTFVKSIVSIITESDLTGFIADDAVPYLLFFVSCLYQVYGFDDFIIDFIMQKLSKIVNKNKELMSFPPIIMLLASIGFVDCNCFNTIVMNYNDLIQSMLYRMNHKKLTTYKELKYGVVLLLYLAQNGNFNTLNIAGELIPRLMEYKKRDTADEDDSDLNEEEEEYEEENSDDDEKDKNGLDEVDDCDRIVIPYQVPFDQFDELAFFDSIAKEQNFYSTIPEELKDTINQFMSK